MHGVSFVTRDLDICIRFAIENLRRFEKAVKDLRPFHRLVANKLPLALTDELCGRLKNLYLETDIGRLDCLGEVKGVGNYDDALRHSIAFKLSYGVVRILDIDALIMAKEAVGRDHDLATVKQLRAIKENLAKRGEPPKPNP
jgi:hypothetical protein